MPKPRSQSSAKRSAEFALGADVLNSAEILRVSLRGMRDQHLRGGVSLGQTRLWQEEYEDFVAAYNATLKTEGLPLAKFSTL